MPKEKRKLRDLVSVAPAMLEDFVLLGITSPLAVDVNKAN